MTSDEAAYRKRQMLLKPKILDFVADGPKSFIAIEVAIGKQELYELGLALSHLIIEGRLERSTCAQPAGKWPVYHVGKLPARFKYPVRPDVRQQHERREVTV